MAANMKLTKDELAKRAESQNNSNMAFLDALSNLEKSSTSSPVENETVTSVEEDTIEEIPVITSKPKRVNKTVTSSVKEEKPGYVSLVITPSLKKKWKTYCSERGLSLTDCIKLSMRLLEDMERKEAISIEDGVLSYLK